MIDSFKKNKILIAVFVVVALIFAWSLLSGGKTATKTSNVLVSTSDSNLPLVDQDVEKLLIDMHSISLDGTVFKTPAFILLRDFGRDVIPEPIGRPNPFAPTEAVSSSASNDAGSYLFNQ